MRFTAFLAGAGITWLLSLPQAWAFGVQDVYGVWRHPDNGSLVQIYRCNKYICGKVVRVANPKRTDVHNPALALRNRPIVGIVILQRGKEIAPRQWSATLYNTLDGGTYYGSLRLISKTTLVLSGCYLREMLCERYTWTRVEPQAAAIQEPKAECTGTAGGSGGGHKSLAHHRRPHVNAFGRHSPRFAPPFLFVKL